ncbi:hypothetical protein ACFOHY_00995 [Rhizobium rosettiformans]|uniref:hypothetical protein n=1 Tax=Rhizobium rosettiformans TaxID=1368430 RepID=UPI00361DF585
MRFHLTALALRASPMEAKIWMDHVTRRVMQIAAAKTATTKKMATSQRGRSARYGRAS